MKATHRRCLNPLLALLLSSTAAFSARAQNINDEAQKPSAESSERERVEETARQAELRRAEEGSARVSYADVLQRPDDLELNYHFAKTQVADGDLKGAAATLERILMINPALPKVHLFYAIVLYRLDNLREALRELETIRKLDMPAELKEEVETYVERIQKSLRRTNWTGTAGVGFQFDDNRNASPSSGKKLFASVPLTLTSGQRRSDFSALFLLGIGVEHDLGLQAGHKVFANLNYYRAEQTLVDSLDLQVYNGNVGAKLNGGRSGLWKLSLPFDHLRLSQQTFLRTYGLKAEWEKRLNNKWGLYAQWLGSRHDYVKTKEVPTALERTGNLYSMEYGVNYSPAPAHRLSAGLGYARQLAFKDYYRYDRHLLSAKHAWLLGKGRFLLTSLAVQSDDYDAPDSAVSSERRHDDTIRAGSTFGYPLGNLWKPLKPVLWTFTYEYFHSLSNVLNYAYTNNKISTMFTYRWDH